MILDILRHANAEDRRSGVPDASRPLTAEGRDRLQRVLKRARSAGLRPTVILSSPLARAVETAEIVAAALKFEGEVKQIEALSPEATPQQTWDALRGYATEPEVLVAGHEPHLSRFTAYVLRAPFLEIDFKKCAMVRVRLDQLEKSPHGVLEWMLTPKVAK